MPAVTVAGCGPRRVAPDASRMEKRTSATGPATVAEACTVPLDRMPPASGASSTVIATALAAWVTERRCAAARLVREGAAAVSSTMPPGTVGPGRTVVSATASDACRMITSPEVRRGPAASK
jgi:hypothetical protein